MPSNSNIPNLFIVGAPRAGTTTVYNYLSQHPDVFMSPVKEPHYFSPIESCGPTVVFKDLNKYLELFSEADNQKIIGEASTSYLFFQQAAKEIKTFNPESKIIIMLRDPVERAFSHYLMDRQKYATEDLNFEDATNRNHAGKFGFHGIMVNPYIEPSLYYNQVKNYFETFAKQNVKILFLEDLKNDFYNQLRGLSDYLQIDPFPPLELISSNKYRRFRYRKLIKILQSKKLAKIKSLLPTRAKEYLSNKVLFKDSYRPNIPQNLREKLIKQYFRDDILNLQVLLNKDLGDWMRVN